MKKIFTFIATALVALGVNAQTTEKALFSNDGAYGNGAEISTAACKAVLGNDRTSKNYDIKLSSCKAYCADLFGQTVMVKNEDTGEMEEKTRVVYVVGNQNPKDGDLDGDTSTGSGYKPANANLPKSGTYYMITPKFDGHLVAFIVLNSGKNFYVCKGSTGENLPLSAITVKADGEEPTEVTLNEDFTSSEKVTGTVEFDVTGGETYYVFCTGSKLSFGGYAYTYEGGGETGETLQTDPALPLVFDSWDVNFLIPKTNVKAGEKFVFSCEPVEVAGWEWGPQVLPKSNADWSDLGPALIPDASGKATFEITEEYATVINSNGGLRVQGMGVKVNAVEYVGGTPAGPEGDKVSIIDKFTGTWNASETAVHNADGSVTFTSVAWGGLSAWLAENDIPVDWSGYTKLVFVYAEPTTVNTQGFVQTTTEDHKWWGNTGITKLECPFDGKDMSQVKQVALQASDVATIVITDIYLVKSADGIEEKVMVPASIINNGAVYNLAGQKVDASYKGIVIQNGRKFIQK